MSGESEEEILATRQKEIEKIHQLFDADGVEINVIASYIDDATRKHFKKYVSDDINWDIFWLSQSLERLAMADMIWLCEGWEYSKGCNVEFECAIQYELDIVYPESTIKGSGHK